MDPNMYTVLIPVSTSLDPCTDNISPSFKGVSSPEEKRYEMPTTRIRNPIEIKAFFSFSLLEKSPNKEKINVTETVMNKTAKVKFTIGETDEKSPIEAADLISSADLPKTRNKNTTPSIPSIAETILVIFSEFMIYHFFWETKISIKVIDESSISFTILSILAIM